MAAVGMAAASHAGPPRAVVAVGASAGGIEALRTLLGRLPADFPAAVLVVVHLGRDSPSMLARVLSRASGLPVEPATDGAPLRGGLVTVARQDHHLVVRDGHLRLGRGPRENRHRPAVDPLFRSAARWYRKRVMAVVLSGMLDDGAAGALSVATHGGSVLVQDPDEAMFAGMPLAALRAVPQATRAPLFRLAELLVDQAKGLQQLPLGDPSAEAPAQLAAEADIAELGEDAVLAADPPGEPSGLACPDCHGVLFEIEEGPMLRYRCRVGHAWSPESLQVEQSEELESALWMALRSLEERAALHRRLADKARATGRAASAGFSDERAAEADGSARIIRELLLSFGRRHEHDGETGETGEESEKASK